MPRSPTQWQADIDKIDDALSALAGETKSSVAIGETSYTRADTDKLKDLRKHFVRQLSTAKKRMGAGDNWKWWG